MSGSLSAEEQADLQEHLKACSECRDDHEHYRLLTQEGMPLLAQRYAGRDVTPSRFLQEDPLLSRKVLARIASARIVTPPPFPSNRLPRAGAATRTIIARFRFYRLVTSRAN